jgi:hypothetical protein
MESCYGKFPTKQDLSARFRTRVRFDPHSMSKEPSSFAKVPKRTLTSQEQEWVREIVLANPEWADVQLAALYVVAECTCGCRSVVIDSPTEVQNPKLLDHQGLVGSIALGIKVEGRDDVVSVLLHFAEGSLSLLEVVWYNFPDPVPSSWIETSRNISVGE